MVHRRRRNSSPPPPTCLSRAGPPESPGLRGKRRIGVIERPGKHMSNWYWPGMTPGPFALPPAALNWGVTFKMGAAAPLASCRGPTAEADG